jgi:hypothetical protein
MIIRITLEILRKYSRKIPRNANINSYFDDMLSNVRTQLSTETTIAEKIEGN